MDNRKLEVTGYTDLAVHVKTHYYKISIYQPGECPACDYDQTHEHVWYDPDALKSRRPAFTKLLYCVRHSQCPYMDPEYNHVHQGNDYRLRTLTVDQGETTRIVEPSIQMSDVNFPTCDLSDDEHPWDYIFEEEREAIHETRSKSVTPEPETCPYKTVVDETIND